MLPSFCEVYVCDSFQQSTRNVCIHIDYAGTIHMAMLDVRWKVRANHPKEFANLLMGSVEELAWVHFYFAALSATGFV